MNEKMANANIKNVLGNNKNAAISITNHCNLMCGYCIAKINNSNDRITIDFNRALDLAKLFGNRGWSIEITGGEPFMVDGVIDLLNEMSKHCNLVVLTNGYNLEKNEYRLNPNIGIICTWHSDMQKIENFFHSSERENTIYKYVCSPWNLKNGRYEKDAENARLFNGKLYAHSFEGVYEGKIYYPDDVVYKIIYEDKRFGNSYMPFHQIKKKNLIISFGYVYANYDFDNIICNIEDIDIEQVEQIEALSYIECVKQYKQAAYSRELNL